jgi:putative transferase (TIGR04331 family)
MAMKELITTGFYFDQLDYEKCIFLGDWCLNDNVKFRKQEVEVLDYPIHTQDLNRISKDLQLVFRVLLLRLKDIFNDHFNIKKDERYYNIVLGRWLFHFLNNVYEKNVLIENVINSNLDVVTRIVPKQLVESDCSEDYNQKSYHSHEFNLIMFSGVIRFNFIRNIKTDEFNLNFNSDLKGTETYRVKKFRFIRNFADLYQNFCLFINRILQKTLVIVVSPNYPHGSFYNSIWFFIRSFGRVVHLKFDQDDTDKECFDTELRESLRNLLVHESDIGILRVASNLLFDFIPKSYLESFTFQRLRAIDWCQSNKKTKLFFTTNAIHTQEKFKYLVAELNGCDLWISQHGFGYGSNAIISAEDYENLVSSRYFTWGWGKHVLPNPKLSIKEKNSAPDYSRILFTFPSVTHYPGLLDSYVYYFVNFEEVISISNSFINFLTEDIREKVIVRQQKKQSLKLMRLTGELAEDSILKFSHSLSVSRFHVTNHFGTPFLESMAMNVPTVIVHVSFDCFFREGAEQDFLHLMEANILFTDPFKAARHINDVYDNPQAWWLSTKTQAVVQDFIAKYAYGSENWRNIWLNEFKNYKL